MAAVWNGAPLGGSAKSLGLVREDDGENTATVTRGTPSKADWTDGSDTLDRKHKPVTANEAANEAANDDEGDDDDPATVLKGQRKITMAELSAPSASTDDDDLNETKRADDEDVASEEDATPVGLKKIPMPVPAPTAKATPVKAAEAQPESGQTRVAPIVVPPAAATAAASPVNMSPNTPAQAWTPPTIPPGALPHQGPAPMNMATSPLAKVLAIPPHKLALGVSMTLMMAALMFVFLRGRPAPPPPAPAAAQFPPPVEVLPPAAMQPPPPTLVLPSPAPTYATPRDLPTQAQPQVATKAPAAPVRSTRAVTRATSRTSIPVHREQ